MDKIQWNRRELKERSKSVLHTHYWRVVLVAFFITLFIGSGSIASGLIPNMFTSDSYVVNYDADRGLLKIGGLNIGVDKHGEMPVEDIEKDMPTERHMGRAALLVTSMVAILIIGIFMLVSSIMISTFIFNPFYVGSMRFFNRSFDGKPKLKEVFEAFEHRYKHIVTIMFLKELYTALWCLLFVIPGIVKSYEYSMIPFILADNPEIDTKEAFALSREMMYGQKWKTFVLDLSFIGWHILSSLTLGILGIFFVKPYMFLTDAALYRKLKGMDSILQNVYYDGMNYENQSSNDRW